jgi:large repetitive protein
MTVTHATFSASTLRCTLNACAFFLLAASAPLSVAKNLPRIDALATATPATDAATSAIAKRVNANASASLSLHSSLAVPTFYWAQPGDKSSPDAMRNIASSANDTVAIARAYLAGLSGQYGISAQAVNTVPLLFNQALPNGGAIVKFRNRIDDVEVFREEAAVLLGADRKLVAIGGFISSGNALAPFSLSAAQSAATALSDWAFGPGVTTLLSLTETRGDYQYFGLPSDTLSADGSSLTAPVRVKPVWFRLPSGLVPAHYVEVQARDGKLPFSLDSYAYVVSAIDAQVLFRHNQTADAAFTYRVFAEATGNNLPLLSPYGRTHFPHPAGAPDGSQPSLVTPGLVTLQNAPFSRNDPWLAPGATTTVGNNVEAFADLIAPDNFQVGDLYADVTTPGSFDRSFDAALAPNVSPDQIKAAVTNLFYMNNWMHDWFYDAGFDEQAGNAQTSNFGRGGLEGDSIRADAQDNAGTDNANMSTPADGARPRMQMYVFAGKGAQSVKINSPAVVAGVKGTATANFGPQSFDVTENVAQTLPADGCSAITNVASITGKIALIDRGTCTFVAKALAAQTAGAVGVIIVNNSSGSFPGITGVGAVTIPVLGISMIDGNAIKSALVSTPVSATLNRVYAVNRDGTMDNTIVAHEWGHYISNRLIANASGLSTSLAAGMGEGWADFHAMLMFVKPGDNLNGTYALAGYAQGGPAANVTTPNNGPYYGLRRYPYSRDLTKNPLTFQHVSTGIALPALPVRGPIGGSNNAAVHNTGEVWASMLWECYSNLLNDTARLSFAQAQDRMKRYLVAGYKLTPATPTFTEARDALLAAIYAQDTNDYQLCYLGFAKRGMGVGAVSPGRFSTDNIGVTESFVIGGAISILSTSVTDTPTYCDADGTLDNGETGTATVVLQNIGTTALAATTVTLSSTNTHVSFPSGATVNVPTTQPRQQISVTLPIRLLGAVGIETASLVTTATDPAFAIATPVTATTTFRVNSDEKTNQSATDDVESSHTVWTTGANVASPSAAQLWQRVAVSATDNRWLGPDFTAPLLTWLQSPPLTVASSGNFSFTFKHRHSFEASGGVNYDGGQLKISTDNGVTWIDIGASATPTYGALALAASGSLNPLAGQLAYVGDSAGYPALSNVAVNLGSTYAGQTVLIRFVIGTDDGTGAPGWEIDDIAFTNIVGTPFDTVIAHADACHVLTTNAGNPQSSAVTAAFATPLKALLKSAGGVPVAGKPVTFTTNGTVGAANAAFTGNTTVNTDINGFATAPTLTANTVTGSYSSIATSGLQTANFALTNVAGPVASLAVVSGGGQSATVNAAFALPLTVVVKDAQANPISGVNVVFVAPVSGASALFSAAPTLPSNGSGHATSAPLAANALPGSYNVTASVGAVSTNFSLANLATCKLDLDGDGALLPHTDGVLLLRYIMNTQANVDLTAGVKNPISLVSAATIQAAVETMRSQRYVDVDGDGVVDSKDALLVVRALLGFRDNAMTAGLTFTGSARATGALQRAWLVANCGLTPP